MKLLCATIYAAFCFATVSSNYLGALKTVISIGEVNHTHSSYTPEDKHAANHVITLMEYVRRMMPVGVTDILPVLEPYSQAILPDVLLNGTIGPVEGVVYLSNFLASGAHLFTVNDIGVSLEDKRLDFNVSVSEIIVDVDFKGIDLILENILVFNTSGSVHITLTDMDITGSFGVEEIDLDGFSYYLLTGIEAITHVENVAVDKFINTSNPVVDQVKDAVMLAVAQGAKEQLSLILINFNVKQVNEFLRG